MYRRKYQYKPTYYRRRQTRKKYAAARRANRRKRAQQIARGYVDEDLFVYPNLRTGGFIGLERKYIDSFRTGIDLGSTVGGSEIDDTTMLCLNGIDQGNSPTTRIGNKITLKSVEIRGICYLDTLQDQADAPDGIVVRIALVLDKQTNGAQLNAEDVYKDLAGTDILSLRNIEYIERFKVLKEWVMHIKYMSSHDDGTNTGSHAGATEYFKCYLKLNQPVRYTTTGATVSSIMDNSLHLIAIASGADGNIDWHSRVKFVDG